MSMDTTAQAPAAPPPLTGVERDVHAIETALWRLMTSASLDGISIWDPSASWPDGAPDTPAGRLIARPVAVSCLLALNSLFDHLASLIGDDTAQIIFKRAEAQAFLDANRLRGLAANTLH